MAMRALCCFITAGTADVLTWSMHSGPERSFDLVLSDPRSLFSAIDVTTRSRAKFGRCQL
jgi:hypothetical protein